MVLRMESLAIELAEPGPSPRTLEPYVGLRTATRITDYVGASPYGLRALRILLSAGKIRNIPEFNNILDLDEELSQGIRFCARKRRRMPKIDNFQNISEVTP